MANHHQLTGKTVFASLYYFDRERTATGRKIVHGVIIKADEQGILIRLSSEDDFLLPPHTSSLITAPSGTYTDNDTKLDFIDPDFLASYKLYDEGNAPSEWLWTPNLDFSAPPVGGS